MGLPPGFTLVDSQQKTPPAAESGLPPGFSLVGAPKPSLRADATVSPAPQASAVLPAGFKLVDSPSSSISKTEEPESATWYGKSWDWLNKPLLDLHRAGATGFEAGAEDVLSGLTSPLSFGLMAGTLGTGPLLSALGMTAKELPIAVQATRALVDAGFTIDQVHGLVKESPQFLDALKYGDYESAKRLGVQMLAGGAFAALGTRHSFSEFGSLAERTGLVKPTEHLAAAREEFGKYQLDVEKAEAERRQLKEDAHQGLDKPEMLPAGVSKYYTPEEQAQIVRDEQDKEFKGWFGDSKVRDKTGKPLRVFHGTSAGEDFKEFSTDGPPTDEEGNPLTTPSGDPNAYMGAHFAQEPGVAGKFAANSENWMKGRNSEGGAKPRIIPAFLKLENPVEFKNESELQDFIYDGKLTGHAGDALLEEAMRADGIHPEEDDAASEEWMQKYDNDKDFRRDQNRWAFESFRPSELGEDGDSLVQEAAADIGREAKNRLRAFGHDGVKYGNRVEGGTSYIAFDSDQIRHALPAQREAATVGAPAKSAAPKPPQTPTLLEEAKQWQTPEALTALEPNKLPEAPEGLKITEPQDSAEGNGWKEFYSTLPKEAEVRGEKTTVNRSAGHMIVSPEGKSLAVRLIQTMEGDENKGVASAMYQHAVEYARANGFDEIISDPEGGTKPGAAKIWRKLGAEETTDEKGNPSFRLSLESKDTLSAYKDSPERAAYRDKVIDRFQKEVLDKAPEVPKDRKPVAFVTLGGTASGKSTLTNALLRDNPRLISVNTDEARMQIPEYESLKKTDPQGASKRVHREAKLLSQEIFDRTVKAGKDFIYDATTAGADEDALIKDLQSKGYHVVLKGVHIPTDEAIIREGVRSKASEDPVNRGRVTPREKILENHKGSVENWNKLKDLADEAHLYDNSGAEMRPVYSRIVGTGELMYDNDAHSQFQKKLTGGENRLTEEEIQNEINKRTTERAAKSANAAAPEGTNAGTGGGVQGELESAVRSGAAGPRPEESGVVAPGAGQVQAPAGGGPTVQDEAGLTRKLNRKQKGQLLGGITRWIEAGGDRETLAKRRQALEASTDLKEKYSTKERAELLAKYDQAMKLTPDQIDFAKRIRESLEQDLEKSYQKGLIRSAVDNYISHFWEDDEKDNPAVTTRKFQGNSGAFDTNVSFAKRRTFGSSFDGEMLGRKLKNDDPIELMSNYRYKTTKAIAAREFMERLHDKGLRMPDGRAMVAGTGSGTTLHDDENPLTFVDPNRVRSTRIAAKQIAEMENNGELENHLSKGTIRQLSMESVRLPEEIAEQLEKNPQELQEKLQSGELKKAPDGTLYGTRPVYGWETGDYKTIDHPAFRDWFFATNAADNSPVYVKSDLRTHPEAADFLRRAIGADRSPIRDLRIGDVQVGKKLLKLSSEAKHLTLSLSPFHLAQEFLRGLMTGINPLKVGSFDLENDTALQQGVVHGLTLLRHPGDLENFQEGVTSHSTIINKIPGLRQIQGEMQHFLFDKYIPGLKARAYKSLFERYRNTYPELSTADAARHAAAHTNEVFGGLNYAQMGRSMASQDAVRLGFLAPDWLESEGRSLYRALDPKHGAVMRQDLTRISLITFAAARALNMLTTGQPHPEAPFGVVIPGKKGEDDSVFSFRTLPVDLFHAGADPRGYLAGRVNPLTVRPGIEGITGRDNFGRRVTPFQEARDFASNIVPIATQIPAKKLLNIQDVSNSETVGRILGASVNRYRTEAEKIAQQKASDRMPSGPVSDQELANHQRNIRLEDGLRNGNITAGQIRQQLPRTTAQSVIDGATLTPLQARFKRLPLADALEVWDMALPREKEELIKEMRAKRMSYVKSHHAPERVGDPNWRKLQAIFGQ